MLRRTHDETIRSVIEREFIGEGVSVPAKVKRTDGRSRTQRTYAYTRPRYEAELITRFIIKKKYYNNPVIYGVSSGVRVRAARTEKVKWETPNDTVGPGRV